MADKKADAQNEKKIGYQKFLYYLYTWFFNDSETFNPFFQYFNSIIFNGNFVTSTNCLERINLALKDTAAGGHVPLSRIWRVLKNLSTHTYLNMRKKFIIITSNLGYWTVPNNCYNIFGRLPCT